MQAVRKPVLHDASNSWDSQGAAFLLGWREDKQGWSGSPRSFLDSLGRREGFAMKRGFKLTVMNHYHHQHIAETLMNEQNKVIEKCYAQALKAVKARTRRLLQMQCPEGQRWDILDTSNKLGGSSRMQYVRLLDSCEQVTRFI